MYPSQTSLQSLVVEARRKRSAKIKCVLLSKIQNKFNLSQRKKKGRRHSCLINYWQKKAHSKTCHLSDKTVVLSPLSAKRHVLIFSQSASALSRSRRPPDPLEMHALLAHAALRRGKLFSHESLFLIQGVKVIILNVLMLLPGAEIALLTPINAVNTLCN